MRVSRQDGQLAARAIAGSRVVLVALDMPKEAADGLLGFAIQRADRKSGHSEWLPNLLRFEQNKDAPGRTLTDDNPVQAFVWGDYSVQPGSTLRYHVEARYGTPDKLEARYATDLDVDVEQLDDGHHGIFFNRGAAGSQAFSERFHDKSPLDDPQAAAWLSRGLEEALLGFIQDAAGKGYALRGAFYEFKHPSVLDALAAAAQRGVDVQLVVARPAQKDSKGDLKYPGDDNVQPVHDAGLDGVVTWRTRCDGIPHNKFLVMLQDDRPVAVWTGSTNITDGALYGQSNVGHLVRDPDAADDFLGYWQDLQKDPPTADLRQLNGVSNPLPQPGPPTEPLEELFSPHKGDGELRWLAALIGAAKESVFFTAPFGISPLFEAVMQTPHAFPIYALLDKGDNNMAVLRATPGNEITAGAFLGHGDWHQFIQEAVLNKLNPNVRYIHTKYLLVDPLTDDPIVVSGSANFSTGSVASNDENMVVLRGDTRVADIYLTEFMRLFTHMYFRARVTADRPNAGQVRAPTPESRGETDPIFLATDSSWTDAWFGGDDAKTRERELFAAGMPAAGPAIVR
jgi:phosphatidylserine/phosphatidylglycerophosphate/cardiolipin synthase-like enzyme